MSPNDQRRRVLRCPTFLCYQLSCWVPKWKARIKYGVSLDLAHIRTLESYLKHRRVYQGSPKYALSDSGLEIELVIPFIPNYDPEDNPQQAQLGNFAHFYPSE
ncbi:uncharacterized protein TNCV_707861 [Trichonephila clavipes]|nr:uncharacterized protein TNCV_707861 [Trichonephila clavipes]